MSIYFFIPNNYDGLVKGLETAMPDPGSMISRAGLISLPRTTIRGHPELFEFNGFRLKACRNDKVETIMRLLINLNQV
jgi:hypothetical protein